MSHQIPPIRQRPTEYEDFRWKYQERHRPAALIMQCLYLHLYY